MENKLQWNAHETANKHDFLTWGVKKIPNSNHKTDFNGKTHAYQILVHKNQSSFAQTCFKNKLFDEKIHKNISQVRFKTSLKINTIL